MTFHYFQQDYKRPYGGPHTLGARVHSCLPSRWENAPPSDSVLQAPTVLFIQPTCFPRSLLPRDLCIGCSLSVFSPPHSSIIHQISSHPSLPLSSLTLPTMPCLPLPEHFLHCYTYFSFNFIINIYLPTGP